MTVRRAAALLCVAAALGCSDDATDMPPAVAQDLEALGLFDDTVQQAPSGGVVPYDVISVLYADESEKLRFVALPPGTRATYHATGPWDYPVGTRFVKTFFYWNDVRDPSRGRRLLETRIIEREAEEWTGRTYLWNDAQTRATRFKVGKQLSVRYIDADGSERTREYRVPNDNECKTCHSLRDALEPLGPSTRQLNHDYEGHNQIDRWRELGLVGGSIEPANERMALADPYGDAPLELRARSYLDANCSHCHREGGEAGASALDLRLETDDPFALGVCRTPSAAGPGSGGRRYDVVPGAPDDSIMVFRMNSTEPKLKMPQLPTLSPDERGVALVREWITGMPDAHCSD